MRKSHLVIGLVPLLVSCGLIQSKIELPEIEEIDGVLVEIESLNRAVSVWTDEDKEEFSFSAPTDSWVAILDSFKPYRRGETGEKGYGAGYITLVLKDGTTFRIRVLVFGPGEMQPALGPKQVNHVGGDASKLYRAIKAAHAAKSGDAATIE